MEKLQTDELPVSLEETAPTVIDEKNVDDVKVPAISEQKAIGEAKDAAVDSQSVAEAAQISDDKAIKLADVSLHDTTKLGTTAKEIVFPDQVVAQQIRKELGLPSDSPITEEDMSHLIDIYLSGVSNIEGLQYAVNLTGIGIQKSGTVSLEPLRNLTKMTSIGLYKTEISDISPLENLINLKTLRLSRNKIKDVTSLKNLSAISTSFFELNHNEIADFSPLKVLVDRGIMFTKQNQTIRLAEQVLGKNDINRIPNPLRDEKGNSVKPPLASLVGGLGYDEETNELLLDGSQLVEGSGEVSFDFVTGKLKTDMSGTVTIPYQRITAQPVTVTYVNQEGLAIHDSKVITGNVSDTYDTTTDVYKLVIPGYVLDESDLPSNAIGTISGMPQTVTYRYKESQAQIDAKDSTLFVGDNWRPADNFISATDKLGKSVDFSDIVVSGVADISKVGTYEISYTIPGASKTITVTVKEKDTPSSDTVTPGSSSDDSVQSESSKTPAGNSQNKLPSTGEYNVKALSLLGLVLLVSVAIVCFVRKRRLD
ncbi:hypothetical protein RU86_GL001879 [Lactococcus piscium]|uniref:Gram-positive cocci surface proteins LPxTG domain-containing protein n=2 Tax=Pseudolactococcus piscium TaxID=1364 RepID=A0A2A5S2Z9_9LACT|nr:hypothetical protein RU86_GL001879 [Lactococcus piscium]